MALINLRNALMAGKRLPYDNEIEFLESTGTQWIDTGIPLKFPISADMTLAMVSPYGTLDALPVFGFRYGGGSAHSKFAIWFSKSQLRFALNYGSYDSGWKGSSVQSGQVVHLRTDGAKLYIDGSLVADGGTVTTSDASNTLTLFQMRDNSSTAARGQCVRYYSCKIYDANNTLVRDYIPVRKGTVGYLYDRVSGKLFGNAGTGDFVLGPDVVPVEYIESFIGSGGGQYINTGIHATTSTKWEIDIAFTTTTTGQLMGSGYAGSQRFNIGIESSAFRGGFGGGWFTISARDTNRHLWRLESLSATQCEASIDGGAAVSYTSTFSPFTGPIILGRRYTTESMTVGARYYASKIWTSGDLVQNLRPVRVGTEGAMMDVLTRRIYRNQGTGAFTYGNDLKYPIPAA